MHLATASDRYPRSRREEGRACIGWGPNSGMLETLGVEYEPPQACPKCGKPEEVITIDRGPTVDS